MHQLVVVPRTHLDFVWEKVKHFIEAGLNTAYGEITVDQIRPMVAHGIMLLIIGKDPLSNDIKAASIMEFTQFPNYKVANIVSMGGDHYFTNEEDISQIRKIAKQYGASKVQCYCKPAQARLFKRALGFEERYTILSQDVQETD